MAQASGVTANAELGAVKQALIASIVQKELAFAAQMPKTITDVSVFAKPGMKSIDFPKTGSLTVANRATGEQGTKSKLTFLTDTLALNQNAYVSWLIDSADELQSNIDVQAEFIKRAATAHARNLDTVILSGLYNAAHDTSFTVGNIDAAKIIAMRKALLAKNANIADITLVVSVEQEAVMLGIDQFVRQDIYGTSNVPSGVIGRVYGIPVMVQNGLPANCNALMYEKSGFCYGFQKGPAYGEQSDITFGVGSKLCAVDQLFGVKALQVAQESAPAGTSPLIVALNAA